MASYAFHNLALDVEATLPGLALDLDRLLEGLSFKRNDDARATQALRLTVAAADHSPNIPGTAREAFRAEGFTVLENGSECFVTDGESLFHLCPDQGHGAAHLADSFHNKPALLQGNFWAYGLMKLFRQKGLYTLHGAGLVSPANAGVVISGPCGCGKSTLSIGLIRAGWGYLSDDALLLREVNQVVEILALRKSFYVDEENAQRYPDLSLGAVVPDNAGGQRRQLALHESHPDQYLPQTTASVLVFPRIVSDPTSTLKPLSGAAALAKLLGESGGQLFDRRSMSQHLQLLKRLVEQTRAFELRSGQDLHRDPSQLATLLAESGV
jgi:hypothetical protein